MLIPSLMQFIHVFEDHEHSTHVSKEMTQVHAQEPACDLCLCHLSEAFLTDSSFEAVPLKQEIMGIAQPYRSMHNHEQLSFSLRAPPIVA